MKDVMLDFETLGTGKDACVIQVGACYFDRKTGEIGKCFKENIDARTAVSSGAVIDADTVYWWLAQSPAAVTSITTGPLRNITNVFNELNVFLSQAEAIWSHATFDYTILQATNRRLDIKPTYQGYRSARDIRTLIDLAKLDIKSGEFVREGTYHDALDDCRFQVKYCVAALNKLGVS